MADILIDKNSLKSIGNAIRHVNGKTTLYTPQQMVDQVKSWNTLTPNLYLYNYQADDPYCTLFTDGWNFGGKGWTSTGYGRILIGLSSETSAGDKASLISMAPYDTGSLPPIGICTDGTIPLKQAIDVGYNKLKIKAQKTYDGRPLDMYAIFSNQISATNSVTDTTAFGGTTFGSATASDYKKSFLAAADTEPEIITFDLAAMASRALAAGDDCYFSLVVKGLTTTGSAWNRIMIYEIYLCKE